MDSSRFLKRAKEIEESHHAANLNPRYDHPPVNHDESNWLVSYADMMTLLCGFFVLLFSIAKVDETKYEKVKESVAQQFGGQYAAPNVELGKFATQFIQQLGIEQHSSLRVDPRGIAITFHSTLLFDTLSAEVTEEGRKVLHSVISQLRGLQEVEKVQYRVVVEGHTDSRPIAGGPYATNWELSGARASYVVRMFLEQGFHPQKLAAIGYAASYPQGQERDAAGNWNDAALSRNRRVVVWVLRPEIDQIPIPDTGAAALAAEAVQPVERAPASPAEPLTAPSAPAPANP